jgi:hypothetical protein
MLRNVHWPNFDLNIARQSGKLMAPNIAPRPRFRFENHHFAIGFKPIVGGPFFTVFGRFDDGLLTVFHRFFPFFAII